MQLLARSSPWRQLFQEVEPSQARASQVFQSLFDVLEACPDELQADAIKAWQLRWVKALQHLDVPAWRISELISDHNACLYRRALDTALAEMRAHGWGPPPVHFCVLLLGSGARYESLLSPDQDNAMILENYPIERHLEIDTWFQHLGERFTDLLDASGIPLCKGAVMARWPLWRKPLNEWLEQMRIWTSGRVVKRVQLSNILFDFTPVYGDFQLEKRFRQELQQLLPSATGFLHEMAELLNEIPVALDAFDRLAGDQQEAPHSDAIHLKRQGLLPLQSAVRLWCLLQGSLQSRSTRERLIELIALKQLSPAEAKDLIAAMNHLQELLLSEQVTSLDAGRQADAWIDRRQLTERQEALLKLDLKRIARLVRLVAKQLPSL